MDDKEYFDADTMMKLKYKGKLIHDSSLIFTELSKNIEVYRILGRCGKRFLTCAVKSSYKDFKLGLKKINKKIPVFVELPTVKSVGEDGTISKTYDGDSSPSSYEVHDIGKPKLEPVKSSDMIDYTSET